MKAKYPIRTYPGKWTSSHPNTPTNCFAKIHD